MRQTPVVVSQYPPTNMGGSFGLPMEQFDEEEEVYEEENPNNEDMLTGGGDPMEVQMDATVEGMENDEEEDSPELVAPQAYISEEFASY